ncbi:hypothetical protein K435DRAFT_804232 [Dendrothele bispora CBS 962.96]|uniref:Uncharacterized protein n=1 Tax=Dendrothele bispora (strain CBS 962.96) TaxID=1314807 RepID=A0A4S8LFP7_DENBC|nr:hypothetical protein K435DRAFT_804232 [Dendrothele bispora CBS 962.96]
MSLIMVMLSSAYLAINLSIGLISLQTLKSSINQDPVILESTQRVLRRLEEVRVVIFPLNYLLGDAVVVWRAWVLVNKKSQVVLSILSLGSIGKFFRYSQRSLKTYGGHTLSSDSVLKKISDDVKKIYIIILESGLLYVIVWIFGFLSNANVLNNEGVKDSENASFPHLAAMYPLFVFFLVVGQKSQIEIKNFKKVSRTF